MEGRRDGVVTYRVVVAAPEPVMSIGTPDLEIVKLWPSSFLDQALPDHEAPTHRLAELAAERASDAVFSIEDPSVEWLKAHVAHGIGAHLLKTGVTGATQWGVHGWFDVQTFEDYRSLRNRPGAYLSGLYVVRSPAPETGLGMRDDRRPGAISFYDPRAGANMNAIKRDPYVSYHHTLMLVPGHLLIWPAYVSYFLHPVLSREPAVRVAFDVQVREETGHG